MHEREASFYRFGPFRLYTPDLLLVCHRTQLRLTPKALATLLMLIRNQGRLVSKDELLEEVWADTFVDEGILARNICELRKALNGHGTGEDFYIETISRRGYRFVPEVQFCGSTPKIRSLAVLPFRGIGLNAQETHLEVGLADAVTTRLANVRDLAVRPTSAVARYSAQEHDSVSAGKALAVTNVLEGVLRKSGEHIRLTLQLVDVGSQKTVWGSQFDEPAADLLRLEDCAAEQVVAALPVKVGGSEWQRVRKRHTDDLQAYHLRLKARSMLHRPAPEVLRESIGLLQQALERDPNYALGYSDLAYCYQFLAIHAFVHPKEVFPTARSSAEKALQLDDGLFEARAALAFAQWHHDFQWTEAERQFQCILELAPNDARMHLQYAMLLGETGRFAASLRKLGWALELDPQFALVHASKGVVLFLARRFDEAIKSCRTALRLDPECFRALWILGVAEVQRGNFRTAIQHLRRGVEVATNHSPALAALVHAYTSAGFQTEAVEALHQLQEMARERYVPASDMAVAYAGLGEIERAFGALFDAIEERSVSLVLAREDPQLDVLRPDPRFRKALNRIGLGG
jgi:DNA-binding winged helix-turn-helix (wHTH) protein/tetratricopeptide (TPR) repeat protein